MRILVTFFRFVQAENIFLLLFYHNCINTFRRGVAQPGRVLAWGARGRRFDSCRPDHFLFVAFLGNCVGYLLFHGKLTTKIYRAWVAVFANLPCSACEFYIVACAFCLCRYLFIGVFIRHN